jgi:voltage-gated potassium channel
MNDKYPVTTEGRIIDTILMFVGVGLFGTFTAYISSWFIAGNNSKTNSVT